MTDRYDKIPISDQTKRGMSLNIDDLGAIGRMLSLQDLVYDERFTQQDETIKKEITAFREALKEDLDTILSQVRSMAVSLGEVRTSVKAMRKDINVLKSEFQAIKNEVGDLNERLTAVECDVVNIKEKLGLQAS
jgi:chromosome segregation ATPase